MLSDRFAHITYGFSAGFFLMDYPAFSFLNFVSFFAYEYVEETKVHDEMYHELKEWSVGFFLGMVIRWSMRVLFGIA